MSSPRFYVAADLHEGSDFTLPEAPAHHLSRVLRLNEGDAITVFNGTGGEFAATVKLISRKQVVVSIDHFDPVNRTSSVPVHLGMCVIKKDAMDSVLSRVTELGVAQVTPIISDHCTVNHKVIRARHDHWQQVIVSACEQCGLNLLPQLMAPVTLAAFVQDCNADMKMIAVPGGLTSLPSRNKPGSIYVLVGPEGGFSREEEAVAETAGFNAVTLGERILRAETAPAVLLSAIQVAWGDFSAS